jgi:hypothetical protein
VNDIYRSRALPTFCPAQEISVEIVPVAQCAKIARAMVAARS